MYHYKILIKLTFLTLLIYEFEELNLKTSDFFL